MSTDSNSNNNVDLSLIDNMDAFAQNYIELYGQPTVEDFNSSTPDRMGFLPFGPSVTEEDIHVASNKILEQQGKKFVPGLGYK